MYQVLRENVICTPAASVRGERHGNLLDCCRGMHLGCADGSSNFRAMGGSGGCGGCCRDDAFAAGSQATSAQGAVPSANDGAGDGPSGGGGSARANHVVLSFEGAFTGRFPLRPYCPPGLAAQHML